MKVCSFLILFWSIWFKYWIFQSCLLSDLIFCFLRCMRESILLCRLTSCLHPFVFLKKLQALEISQLQVRSLSRARFCVAAISMLCSFTVLFCKSQKLFDSFIEEPSYLSCGIDVNQIRILSYWAMNFALRSCGFDCFVFCFYFGSRKWAGQVTNKHGDTSFADSQQTESNHSSTNS